MKAKFAAQVETFLDIPNVGPAMVKDFDEIGIRKPSDLKSKDALTLYHKLCKVTKKCHDPCVLDTFLAVVDFMNGAPARPWWQYTPKRKKNFPAI